MKAKESGEWRLTKMVRARPECAARQAKTAPADSKAEWLDTQLDALWKAVPDAGRASVGADFPIPVNLHHLGLYFSAMSMSAFLNGSKAPVYSLQVRESALKLRAVIAPHAVAEVSNLLSSRYARADENIIPASHWAGASRYQFTHMPSPF
jgi:hypothetical protein